MSETDASVLCNRAGNAECLKSDTDSFSSFGSGLAALFECDTAAESICPYGVFKSDILNALDNAVYIYALGIAESLDLFEILEADGMCYKNIVIL